MPSVSITIGGVKYEGWTSFSITRSIETLTGEFTLTVTDAVDQVNNLSWPLQTQKEVQIKVDDQLLITGYIFKVNPSIDDNTHSITINGRDKTADLVDCSADLVAKNFSFNTTNIKQLAETLCATFGIPVKVQEGTKVTEKFQLNVNSGESVFELLDRKAKELGVLLISDPTGALVIANSKREKASVSLQLGINILSGTSNFDYNDRYSTYKVIGQSKESKDWRANINIKGTATDTDIARYRPLLIDTNGEINSKRAQIRANWEANIRAARSQEVTVDVQGFFEKEAILWQPNKLVQILAPALYVNPATELLITSVTYSLSNEGTKTTLTLKRPDAFKVEPDPTVKTSKNLGFAKSGVSVAAAQ